jgi:hypothetical protein
MSNLLSEREEVEALPAFAEPPHLGADDRRLLRAEEAATNALAR